jgi:hypothetical protein
MLPVAGGRADWLSCRTVTIRAGPEGGVTMVKHAHLSDASCSDNGNLIVLRYIFGQPVLLSVRQYLFKNCNSVTSQHKLAKF